MIVKDFKFTDFKSYLVLSERHIISETVIFSITKMIDNNQKKKKMIKS